MSAIVTDQFRILNANNFVDSVENTDNSYYVFLSLPNPSQVGFGRDPAWNTNTPVPIDNFNYQDHVYDTMLFGKKITSANIRRVVRRIDWTKGTRYEMYRHDYSVLSPSPLTQSSRLYDTNYYVINSEYKVYICIDNGSSGINTVGNASQDEPTFTDLEPSKAGESGDGYIWKYLFTVSPGDIIKFDSTEYITVPNNWSTTTESQIQSVRENGDSTVNDNQIKKVYIENRGANYSNGLAQEVDILGDGIGGKVLLDVANGRIINTIVSSGGKNYSYGIIDLGSINSNATGSFGKLIPIIPPSRGHGFDIYKELGTDKVLVYARFDDSTKDFPIDTKFAQVGIVKNPTSIGSTSVFVDNQFSALYSVKFSSITGTPVVGEKITQSVAFGAGKALGYVASYDSETRVLKYIQDRSLYFNQTSLDQTDYIGISSSSKYYPFESSANPVTGSSSGFSGSVDTGFSGISTNPTGNKLINLGTNFTNGISNPEINKRSGEIIYLDNRPLISRNTRQKEDVKIILEF
jgi:hypothetical protein